MVGAEFGTCVHCGGDAEPLNTAGECGTCVAVYAEVDTYGTNAGIPVPGAVTDTERAPDPICAPCLRGLHRACEGPCNCQHRYGGGSW